MLCAKTCAFDFEAKLKDCSALVLRAPPPPLTFCVEFQFATERGFTELEWLVADRTAIVAAAHRTAMCKIGAIICIKIIKLSLLNIEIQSHHDVSGSDGKLEIFRILNTASNEQPIVYIFERFRSCLLFGKRSFDLLQNQRSLNNVSRWIQRFLFKF